MVYSQCLNTGGVVESEVDQIDLVPTLSELLGLPIPSNNLGHLLMDMVQEQGAEEQLASLLRNTIQLLNLLREDQPGADSGKSVSHVWPSLPL